MHRGFLKSRSRARDLILRGHVSVGGSCTRKPGQLFPSDVQIEIDASAGKYASRAAEKLIAALDEFGFDPSGRNALDIGASNGGFTQVLLERGASHVTAVDVGSKQLSDELRTDARVTCLEGLDARSLTKKHLPEQVTALTVDVSFISLTKGIAARASAGHASVLAGRAH